jgi:hypothetical protein
MFARISARATLRPAKHMRSPSTRSTCVHPPNAILTWRAAMIKSERLMAIRLWLRVYEFTA